MVNVTVQKKSGAAAFVRRATGIDKLAAYVGVPAATSRERSAQLLGMAGKTASAKRQKKLRKAAAGDVSNAETLFLLSEGSPLRGQPPRPVLGPAVTAAGNREPIAREIALSKAAHLRGDRAEELHRMRMAALAGQNAARRWFTDPRNNWAPNAPATIRRKGSDRPGIDTGATRAAIVGVVGED